MMDFSPSPHAAWSENFVSIIDRAMQANNAAQPSRSYLGASRLGEECVRKLAYEWHGAPKDEGREFSGKILRVFERGHTGEDLMAARLRLAGFTLVTHKPDGGQIGFATGNDPETGMPRIAGHCDGVITAAPYESGLVTPCLWECKILNNKSWNDTVKKGVERSKPIYFVQMQLYMAYLDLGANPGLFTAENGDTGEIYAEKVPFNLAVAQAASDRGVKVVTSSSPEEFSRIAREPTDFRCRFCDFSQRCWSAPTAAPAAAPAPTWMGGS